MPLQRATPNNAKEKRSRSAMERGSELKLALQSSQQCCPQFFEQSLQRRSGSLSTQLHSGVYNLPSNTEIRAMQNVTSTELARDTEAVQIPHGSPVTLPKGTPVDITQTLGGTFTVHAHGGLYRISGKDADALGMEVPVEEKKPSGPPVEVDEKQVWEMLRSCYDPEIPVNIVDLGLVYDLAIEKVPSGYSKVSVKMTLTAPGCGMGGVIAGDAQQKILALDGVEEATVEVVWDPPWHQSMISEQGRRILGLE